MGTWSFFRLNRHETFEKTGSLEPATGASDGALGPPNARSRVWDGRCLTAVRVIYKGERAVALLS